MRRSVSFSLGAIVSLLLLILFYVFALGMAATLLFIPYAMVVYGHRIYIKVGLGCLAGAYAILRGCIFVHRPTFEEPGVRVDEVSQPQLFELLRGVATRLKTKMPERVYLVPEPNAFVTQVGGWMGFGSTRIMGIGVGLMALCTVSELEGVIAHEFGHYVGGDTMLGGIAYRTRVAIGRTLASLGDGWLVKPFQLYASFFLRVTRSLGRHQELQADAVAVELVGSAPFVSGLRKSERGAALFDAFTKGELAPVAKNGFRPTSVYESFSRFSAIIEKRGDFAVNDDSNEKADPFDTHPPTRERIAAAEALQSPGVIADTRPAMALLRTDKPAIHDLEAAILKVFGGRPEAPHLEWSDAAIKVHGPQIAREASEVQAALAKIGMRSDGTNVDTFRVFGLAGPARGTSNLAKIAFAVEPDLAKVRPEVAAAFAPTVIARALGVLASATLIDQGGAWKTDLGEPLVIVIDGIERDPLTEARKAIDTPAALSAYCAKYGYS